MLLGTLNEALLLLLLQLSVLISQVKYISQDLDDAGLFQQLWITRHTTSSEYTFLGREARDKA